ncbi:MAG: HAD family hydrolase [bacterium]|nr:HAD family hydrolase [bacterium]
MIKAIIFDLDDTLYSEITFVRSGFIAVARYAAINFKVSEKEFYKKLINRFNSDGRGKIFDNILTEYNLFSKRRVALLVNCYQRHIPNIVLYSEVRSILHALKKKYGLGIITDGKGMVQRKKVRALKLKFFFDCIMYTHDYGKEKPHPFSFKKMLLHFQVQPEEAVYIGNNPYKDFIGARRVGLKTIRILRGDFKFLKLNKKYEADYCLQNLKNLPKLLTVL